MRMKSSLYGSAAAVAVALVLTATPAQLCAQPSPDPAIRIGDADLGGVVTGPNGPEAGVWWWRRPPTFPPSSPRWW